MTGAQRCGLVRLLVLVQLLMAVTGQQSYVVYMGTRPEGEASTTTHHAKLVSLLGSQDAATESLIYSYKNFNSFAAKLTPEEAAALIAHEDVISVFPNKAHSLHTTHSWAFLGLEDDYGNVPADSLWTKSNYGKDVVIGLLDSGIWPESESFNDAGLGPIPASWKGECTPGDDFGPAYCNKKLIGGRFFIKGFEAAEGPLNLTTTADYISARDVEGHGTHTSTTAGGSFVTDANLFGLGRGTAKGGAPLARIAMYKVCWARPFGPPLGRSGCYDADILMAFDQGISDGVNVFSVSLGPTPPLRDFFEDGLAIGAFHAAQRNIPVVCSAGNNGPIAGTISNVAPWITSVGSASIDRDFASYAVLGNNLTIHGESLSQDKLEDSFYPLVSSADIYSSSSNSTSSQWCLADSLDPAKASGKIVVCLRGGGNARVEKGKEVKTAGGIGMILANDLLSTNGLFADPHVLPATHITYDDGVKVYSYLNSTPSPIAKLSPATGFPRVKPAPEVSAYSSLGPNSLVPDMLKPDLAAPGLSVLAAFSPGRSITGMPGDTRTVKYNILSGTSMACPHVAGAMASLKAYHPTWTPDALRSALVTTATLYGNDNQPILNMSSSPATPFGIGGGYINPNAAAEPGLVYDNEPAQHFKFLCSLNYTIAEINAISGENYTCPPKPSPVSDFNYPTLTVSELGSNVTVKRTVTNVGGAACTYTVTVDSPPGIHTTISPSVLKFSALGQKKTFSVKLTKVQSTQGQYSFGSYTWTDGTHSVRSPMAIKTSQ